jgi:hypothetical protein
MQLYNILYVEIISLTIKLLKLPKLELIEHHCLKAVAIILIISKIKLYKIIISTQTKIIKMTRTYYKS